MTIRFNPSIIEKIQQLPKHPDSGKYSFVPVLLELLKCTENFLKIIEWGAGRNTELFIESSKVEKVVSYENDSACYKKYISQFQPELNQNERLSLELIPFEVIRPVTHEIIRDHYRPTHDYVLDPLNRYGENAFDLAFIDGGGYRTDCAEISKLLVKDGGLIIWHDIESWQDNTQDFPSGRRYQDVFTLLPEYYYIDRHRTLIIINRKTSDAFSENPRIGKKHLLLKKTFEILTEERVLFVLLRNADEIPASCSLHKDVDLLIHPEDFEKSKKLFKKIGYIHRSDNYKNHHLYSAKPHAHFQIPQLDIHIDVVQGLYYTSPNSGEKVPIHSDLQKSIFNRRRCVADIWKFIPNINDLFIHIVCHSIYDKAKISERYKEQLERLFPLISDWESLKRELHNVFFAFTPRLLQLVKNKQAENIVDEYYQFSEY